MWRRVAYFENGCYLCFRKDNAIGSPNEQSCNNTTDGDGSSNGSREDGLENNSSVDKTEDNDMPLVKPPKFQKGVLRTNCIDCLDRTNVAQYAYGLAALGHQLHALGFIDAPRIDLDAPLADDLMSFYETMGDTLAHQYGGSAAHNKVWQGFFKLLVYLWLSEQVIVQ